MGIIEQQLSRGVEPDAWFLDEPEVANGDSVYFDAFWKLSSGRQIGGGMIAPISWDAVNTYGRSELGFDAEWVEALWLIVSAMDAGFCQHMLGEFKKATKAKATPKNAKAKGRR